MALWRVSWKEFSSRPLRTLLTLSSIIIGVASVVAVQLAIEDSRVSQRSMLQAVAGNASLEIHSDGGAPFSTDIIDSLKSISGIKIATPVIRRYGVMFDAKDNRIRVQILGVDPTIDASVREYRIREGETLGANDQALLDSSFAKSLGFQLNATAKVMTNSGLREATIVGLIEPASGSAVLQGGLVVLTFRTAQKWFRADKRCDIVQIVLNENVSVETIHEKIAAVLPENLQVQLPVLRSELGREASFATEQGLRLASAFSLLIAIFIIYNTFQMNVGERRKQLGILRALGTTRKQIVRLIVTEGFMLGIVGTFLGWVLGYFGAKLLTQANSELLDVAVSNHSGFIILPYLLGALCGMSVSIVGALFPAQRASRLSPAEAMRTIASGELEPSNQFLAYAGALLSAIGLAVLIGCIQKWWDIDHAIAGCVLFLLGGIVALPTVIHTFIDWILFFLNRILGVEGRLAERQLLKHRGRSSLTIGILFIALSTGLGLSCTILDNIRDVRGWYENALLGDYFVRAAMPSMATGQSADMPDGLMEEFQALPEVKSVESLRFVNSRSGDFAVVIVAREYKTKGRKFFDLKEGDADEVFDALHRGEVVIGTVLSERAKLKIGDRLQLNTQEGMKEFLIAGIANDYVAAGLTIYMSRTQAEKLLNIQGTDAIIIDSKEGQKEAAGEKIRAIAMRESLLFQSQTDLIDVVKKKVDGVVAGLWGVLALCSVIATFGLVNTLTMNILEQTYEIGMLRIVAMTRSQVRKMILCQAIMMALIALIPAVLAGTFITYLLALANGPTTGHAVSFEFRPGLTAMAFTGEMVLIFIASMIPAERAARMKLTDTAMFQ